MFSITENMLSIQIIYPHGNKVTKIIGSSESIDIVQIKLIPYS